MNKATFGAGIFRFNRRRKESLHRQIFESVREAILSANLQWGAAVPATRSLAAQLNVSRLTVVNAYDQLLAEGYISSRGCSGTFVNCELPDDRKLAQFVRENIDGATISHRFSDWLVLSVRSTWVVLAN